MLEEAYRVLKPGGLFITLESEWDWEYDRQKIDAYFGEHEKLYGIYTQERVRERLAAYEVMEREVRILWGKHQSGGFQSRS